MKRLTVREANRRIEAYFASRRKEKRGADGQVLLAKDGQVLTEERPSTVTGLILALGFTERSELDSVSDQKVKALLSRALLRIEEEAEEKLFSKETYQGAKAFLNVNFKRWSGEVSEEESAVPLGICSDWSE